MSSPDPADRPIALITGVSRKIGIGASIAKSLAGSGWDLALSYWKSYDYSMPWGSDPEEIEELLCELREMGAGACAIEKDLALVDSPSEIFTSVNREMGSVSALILSHCYSVDSDIKTTTVESFDQHFAVNARAVWLLVKEYESQFSNKKGYGRIIALTSDHTAGNLPYGASKGALDRIVIACATEFRDRGITANVINPGATDTGWITENLKENIQKMTLLDRIGRPRDCANLVNFICSREGGWINGQLLHSNGGME